MESRIKKDAIRAKEIALQKMQSRDFLNARNFAVKAKQLSPDLDSIDQIIMVCDVHCSLSQRVCEDEKDWYKILNVEPTADEASIRRQYSKMALSLHPDKNSLPGAAEAFQLVVEAKTVLSDNDRRRLYDSKCRSVVMGRWNSGFARFQSSGKSSSLNGGGSKQKSLNEPTTMTSWLSGGASKQKPLSEPKRRGRKKKVAAADNDAPRNVSGGDEVETARTLLKRMKRGNVDANAKKTAKQTRKTTAAKERGKNGASAAPVLPDSKILEYFDGEFNDFEKERGGDCFGAGQVWAVYDTLDAMPRFYAVINKVIAKDFKVLITWLEPLPNNEDEKKWLYQGLPAAFGKFRLGHSETIDDRAVFSHLVNWKKSVDFGSNIYEIYPRKGEIWALFKNWDIDWYKDPESHRVCEFELVEVVSDYYGGFGVTVAFLSKMEGLVSSFCRKVGKGVNWEVVQVKNKFRFSHKIPSFPVTMKEGLNGVKNFFELDPASLPSNISSTS